MLIEIFTVYSCCRAFKKPNTVVVLFFRHHMLVVFLFTIFLTTAFGIYCVDDQKEWCQGHELWGWCLHNKTDGRFNCDNDGFCGEREKIKFKKSTGCFLRENDTVCCCNEADGCNLGFIAMDPKYAVGQKCTNTIEEPGEDLKIFKDCDDPWCFAYLQAEIDDGLTTAYRGCRSRKTLIYQIAKDQHEEEEVKNKGRLCCCRGGHKCNERFTWTEESVSMEELTEIIRKRDRGDDRNDGSSFSTNIAIRTISIIYMIVLKF
ncbi:hypothetical protein DICVIV_12244 [Dictyocaulus viviparus]|uniref:Uncharacterized protein n=1 Tax=Dictyocaulus viviparus TaxID=29172 RepID=A0A0D8XHG2_DICVI|nr:hypothetical protein DICVIV_12244 [Dictyocaulus viviparus]